MNHPIITLTSDFGVQSQGVGIMEGVIASISPDARVIHLMHGLPDYDITCAARTLETLTSMPVGFHLCVVDPGVGTKRRGIIIKTKRGDYLVGPDNGVFIPAVKLLGGCEKIVEITNPKYMRQPVSPVFHGRDVFSPAAAHLSIGVRMEEFGKEISFTDLVSAPYEEAILRVDSITAQVIHSNKYGSPHLNILHKQWDTFGVKEGQIVIVEFNKKKVELPCCITFGDVPKNKPLILKDDYGRVALSINMGSFAKEFGVKVGDTVVIKKKSK